MPNTTPYRVVQWTTGNVGKSATNPTLELVGCYAGRRTRSAATSASCAQDGWVIEVAGRPTVTMKVGFLPPPDFEATTLEEFMVLGHIMTATPPLNAIPAVVAAAPGIVTYNDLPLILPRGVVPTA